MCYERGCSGDLSCHIVLNDIENSLYNFTHAPKLAWLHFNAHRNGIISHFYKSATNSYLIGLITQAFNCASSQG